MHCREATPEQPTTYGTATMKCRCRRHTRLYQPGCSAVRAYTRLLLSSVGVRLYQPQWQRASRRQSRQIHGSPTLNLCMSINSSPHRHSAYPSMLPCMNLLHHRLRLYQPSQNQQRGVTGLPGASLLIREQHGPGRGFPMGTTTSAMVQRGDASPSLN